MNPLHKKTIFYSVIAMILGMIGCKRPMQSLTSIKSLTQTHTLEAEFVEASGKIKYSFVGKEFEKEQIKSVKVSQLKTGTKAVFYKDKIGSNFLMGYDEAQKFYPHYSMEIETARFSCRTTDTAWMGAKEIPLNCVSTGNSKPTAGSDTSPEEPRTSEDSRDPKNPSTSGNKDTNKAVPNSAAECSGAKIRNYTVCRFFEGGDYGCYEKHRCITRMNEIKCNSIKSQLKAEYPWMASRWNCSSTVSQ